MTFQRRVLELLDIVETHSYRVEVIIPVPFGQKLFPGAKNEYCAIMGCFPVKGEDPRLAVVQALREKYQLDDWASKFSGVCTYLTGDGADAIITYQFKDEQPSEDFAADVQDKNPEWKIITKINLPEGN